MERELVSIIIATYNSENTIRTALESVNQLSFDNWECIIVDGLSNDQTVSIVDQYSKENSKIRYISEKDTGIYNALNKGWRLAKGNWIYVLGSDDTLTPTGLKELLDNTEKTVDVVYGNVFLKSKDGHISNFIAKSHSHLKYVMNCSHQAVIVRKSLLEKLGGFQEKYRIRADFDLLQRAFLAGFNFKKVDSYVAYFLEDGLSSNADYSTHIERYEICKNNKSTSFPLFWYLYQESKFYLKLILSKVWVKVY